MSKYDLSILIPARNEMFLSRTVQDILDHKRGKTEIIVALDGKWADPVLPDHDDVTIIYFPESIGQRAATNQACRLSKAKYVMKLDAHCSFDEGFDVKLMEDMQDDITMIPVMYNLHAFDWVCKTCGNRTYQGPTPKKCFKKDCPGIPEREMVWQKRSGTGNYCYRFDTKFHFQYHPERKHHPENKGHLVETMSAQGSCFMLTRENYWKLNICDEQFGSWGQQGFEVAMKTWMSGGRLVSNKRTWYAHMFRTQGGDFGFPYPQSGRQLAHARKLSKELVEKNQWPYAVRDFNWLLNKFYPVPEWHDESKKITKGIVFYTDNQVSLKIAHRVQKQLRKIGLPIVSASLKPMPHFGKNIHIAQQRGYLTMFRQQLAALEASDADIVFMCEHDVLYHPSHFEFTPPRKDVFYYNINVWKISAQDGFALKVDVCQQVSGLCAYRQLLIDEYKRRIARVEKEGKFERGWGYEPGTKNLARAGFSDYTAENWTSEFPNLDIRGNWNLTINRWTKDKFRHKENTIGWTESRVSKIPGWNLPDKLI